MKKKWSASTTTININCNYLLRVHLNGPFLQLLKFYFSVMNTRFVIIMSEMIGSVIEHGTKIILKVL